MNNSPTGIDSKPVPADFIEVQQTLIRAIAADVPGPDWVAIIVDYEILEIDGGFETDYLARVINRDHAGNLSADQFFLSREARDAGKLFYRQRKTEANEVIGGFVLRLDRAGRFRLDIRQEPPTLLSGGWDADWHNYLEQYLTHYKLENGLD